MAARDFFNVVECYGTDFLGNENLGIDIDQPFYRVRGKSFDRMIYRPIGSMDVLLGQSRDDDEEMYEFFSFLPVEAMQNRDLLLQSIAEFPPPAHIRVIPEQFDNLGWNWNNFATILADYVDNANNLDGVNPFGVEGVEAFGTITLIREDNRWRDEDWRQNPPGQIAFTECNICGDHIVDTPINDLLGLNCCQHVFHRSCILPWVWRNHANPSCPICNSLI
ncbi:hypothetical protein HA466_0199120 [Hirschfeldia incana]|nr:hypothetical protein HA466_0199120 [Hirschfeldia incana]